MPTGPFQLTYEDLAPDCSAPRAGKRGTRENLAAADVHACLVAYAAIPSMELVEIDARLILRTDHRQVAVSRSGSTLYFTPLPEASNTPVASTPDGILAHLTGLEPVPAPVPTEAPAIEGAAPVPARRSLFKLSPGAQIAIFAVTASVAAGLLYRVVNAPPPGNYTWIQDSSQAQELHSRLDGDYGDPFVAESLSFVISGGTLTIYYTTAAKAPREKVRSGSFKLAQRQGGIVALIMPNNDVAELTADGSLLYGDQVYRRAPRR